MNGDSSDHISNLEMTDINKKLMRLSKKELLDHILYLEAFAYTAVELYKKDAFLFKKKLVDNKDKDIKYFIETLLELEESMNEINKS